MAEKLAKPERDTVGVLNVITLNVNCSIMGK
jgi:hypothetical protein